MPNQHKLRDDVTAYTRDYALLDGRMVLAPERLEFWREYFRRLPETQKTEVVHELLAWTIKCVRIMSEDRSTVESGLSGLEGVLDNTATIVAEAMAALPLDERADVRAASVAPFARAPVSVAAGASVPAPPPGPEKPSAGRLDERVAFNLEQMHASMTQARSEAAKTSRLFRTWMAVGLGLIALGIVGMIFGLVVPGLVTSASSILPGGLAATLYQKDKDCQARLADLDKKVQASDRFLTAMASIEAIEDGAVRTRMRKKLVDALIRQMQDATGAS